MIVREGVQRADDGKPVRDGCRLREQFAKADAGHFRRDGGELIEVNPEETPLSHFATQLVREPAAVAMPQIVDALIQCP